jgi:hypothetical protein
MLIIVCLERELVTSPALLRAATARFRQYSASTERRGIFFRLPIICSPALAQHVCGSEHDSSDKREHAGKQHNVDDELDHHTPPLYGPLLEASRQVNFCMRSERRPRKDFRTVSRRTHVNAALAAASMRGRCDGGLCDQEHLAGARQPATHDARGRQTHRCFLI